MFYLERAVDLSNCEGLDETSVGRTRGRCLGLSIFA